MAGRHARHLWDILKLLIYGVNPPNVTLGAKGDGRRIHTVYQHKVKIVRSIQRRARALCCTPTGPSRGSRMNPRLPAVP